MTKPFSDARHRETLSIAEQAEQWRQILKSAGPKERAAFWTWARQSSLHLREVLLADALEDALERMDPDKKIHIEQLTDKAKATSNVVSIGYSGLPPPVRTCTARRRWWSFIALGALVALLVVY